MSMVHEVEKLLPQTQCQACGFAGCRPYAQAIVTGQAPINKCPPGGVATLKALANLLKIDWRHYVQDLQERKPATAVINEQSCIGCTKCIQACPVDAIIGSAKQLHTIISWECTGCGLCVEPCPVDCIELQPISSPAYDKDKAKDRYANKILRNKKQLREQKNIVPSDPEAKLDYIKAALARVSGKHE